MKRKIDHIPSLHKRRIKKLNTKARRGEKPAVRTLGKTEPMEMFYKFYLKPFIKSLTFTEEQSPIRVGLELFFGINERSIQWCKVIDGFHMPGETWASSSAPFTRYNPSSGRYVAKGKYVLIRRDTREPLKAEVEFNNNVYVLTAAQLELVLEKVKVVA